MRRFLGNLVLLPFLETCQAKFPRKTSVLGSKINGCVIGIQLDCFIFFPCSTYLKQGLAVFSERGGNDQLKFEITLHLDLDISATFPCPLLSTKLHYNSGRALHHQMLAKLCRSDQRARWAGSTT